MQRYIKQFINLTQSSLKQLQSISATNFSTDNPNSDKDNLKNKLYDTENVTKTLMNDYANFRERSFVDKVRFKVKAGDGGNGCISFFRDRSVVSGAPDGGDGGNGGNVIFKAVDYFNDLRIFRKKEIKGNNGKPGMKLGRDGKNGNDIHISVPTGTLVYEILSEKFNTDINIQQGGKLKKREYYKKFLIDLDKNNSELMIVKGGKGGRGNGKHRGIKEVERGNSGQIKEVYLELKSIADVGLVGYPNAGKSTFLAAVSRSLPKIASYPFTTLAPLIGKIKFIDDYSFTIADIPGIIEDSHKNKGLGLEFLRHIERTKVLVFMIDISSFENKEPWKQLETLRRELLMYRPDFLERPSCIIANKSDIEQDADSRFAELQKQTSKKCFLVSAKHNVGLGDALLHVRKLVEEIKQKEQKILEEEQLSQQSRIYNTQQLNQSTTNNASQQNELKMEKQSFKKQEKQNSKEYYKIKLQEKIKNEKQQNLA